MVGLPCGHRYFLHGRCVVEAIRRGGSHAQLICGTRGCTSHHGKRESLEAAGQADPGLRYIVEGLGGRPDNNWSEQREGFCNPWGQYSLGIAAPLDDGSLEQLQLRFITIVKAQSGLATAHAKLVTHVLGLLKHALETKRPNRHFETPSSLLSASKLWYIVPVLLHLQDSHVKRRYLRMSYVVTSLIFSSG